MSISPFGFPEFDPSKMDPKLLMQLSQLIQQLPPEQLHKMQTLMHNAMAGFDVKKDMEEFERNLPPGFREKLMSVMGNFGGGAGSASSAPPIEVAKATAPSHDATPSEMNLREARVTLLRGVANGSISPEEAERLLFPEK